MVDFQLKIDNANLIVHCNFPPSNFEQGDMYSCRPVPLVESPMCVTATDETVHLQEQLH